MSIALECLCSTGVGIGLFDAALYDLAAKPGENATVHSVGSSLQTPCRTNMLCFVFLALC